MGRRRQLPVRKIIPKDSFVPKILSKAFRVKVILVVLIKCVYLPP